MSSVLSRRATRHPVAAAVTPAPSVPAASAPPRLAERLAGAENDEAVARQAEVKLSARYMAAVAASDHQQAAHLRPQLDSARDDLLLAEAHTAALRSTIETAGRRQAEKAREEDLAQQRAQAQDVIGEAMAAERQADSQGREHLDRMYACLQAAQREFRLAQAAEDAIGNARRQVAEQRVLTGELAAMPGRMHKPNFASVLLDTDETIRAVMRYDGPVQGWIRTAAAMGGVVLRSGRLDTDHGDSARGVTQPAPWGGGQ